MRSLLVASLLFVASAAAQNLVVNGSFEQNGGAGTNTFTGWTVVDQQGGSGSWFAQTGDKPLPLSLKCHDEDVQRPPAGTFAAMTTQSIPGSHILYQDAALPASASKITLSYDLFLLSSVPFTTQPTLDFFTKPNTQFRVDVLDPAAEATAVGSGVLANVFQTNAGDPTYEPYRTLTFDLTPFAGRTIRLRFTEVDDVDCFNAGVDDVSIVAQACPSAAPSQLAIADQCLTGCSAGQPVSFVATSPSYAFVACDAYAWDFGDGTTSGSAMPLHTFAGAGTFVVNLSVTNSLGTSSARSTITIAPPHARQRTVRH